MGLLRLLLLAVIAGLLLLPATALAQTSDDVTVTASGNVTTGCPSHLIITQVGDYEIELSWTPAGNATTLLRANYDTPPANTTDGFPIYEGNATTTTHWVNPDLTLVPTVYRAWANHDGNYSECYTDATLLGVDMGEIADALTSISAQMANIWDVLSLWSLFVVPLLCAIAYQWRGSIIFAVPCFLSAWLAAPYVATHGWHFAAPLVVLAILIILKLLYQAFTSGIKV